MIKELDDSLCQIYPKIFIDRHGSPSKTSMCWGFPGDGWYILLHNLCFQIQQHCDNFPEIQQVVAAQVKEKFGSLRFYYNGGDTFICSLVNKAEEMSKSTCEICGELGKINSETGWFYTACEKHIRR